MYGLRFQVHQKMNHYILDWLNKSKPPGFCGFPLANLHSGKSVDYVPDENIGTNLEELCIRRGNLKYLNNDIADSNVKIIGYPNLLSG